MNIGELIQSVQRFVQDASNNVAAKQLAREALALTDMVSWASGVIDGKGLIDNRLETLQSAVRERHTARPDEGVAVLHDAIGELRDAIMRHDLDLVGESDDDHTVDM